MPVYQVEEYYLHIERNFSDSEKESIEKHLSDEGYSNYSFEDGFLVVDDVPSESEGETLEDEIYKLIGGE